MSDPRPKELIRAEELTKNGRMEEALKIIMNFERISELSPKDQLSALIQRGYIYNLKQQHKKTVEVGELVYSMSQELGLIPESIDGLILKAWMVRFGKVNEAFNLIFEAEKLFSSLSDDSPVHYANLNLHLKSTKAWIYFHMGDHNKALELATEALPQAKNTKNMVMVASNLFLIGYLYYTKTEFDTSLEYVMKSIELFEALGFQVLIAANFGLLGEIYFNMGDLNRALEFSNKALSIEKISDYHKHFTLSVLGRIYQNKGELDKALKYYKSIKGTEDNYVLMVKTSGIGEIYRIKGEKERAQKYFKQSLLFSEKFGSDMLIFGPLFYLFLISLDYNSLEQAHHYLKRIENAFKKPKELNWEWHEEIYSLGKALLLKASSRMHDHVDAERLLKQIIEDGFVTPPFYSISIVSLCELLLEELAMYNNPEVLEDINPLILKLLDIAETQHSFSGLAEGKLLQAKLALIQMDLDNAKVLLTQAQQIAEERGLNLLAQKISSEHDLLLEKVDEWDKLKKEDAPMAKRIELASVEGVMDRLQGKRAVDPPELVEEEPILLLIMDNSGIPYFNHSFVSDWDTEGIFSSFMSAFNTFSSELFSKSIDRIRIGENVILISPIESFLACYVIKGQSYPALQKLTRFSEAIKDNSEIWQALEKSVKTSEMLELDKPPALKTVINEIFTQ
ncbi:MAG: tetratricopeptide repeat protein [Candidatus Hodarchaeales archaeon]